MIKEDNLNDNYILKYSTHNEGKSVDKFKVVLNLSNYTTNLAAKKYFIALKAEVDNLDINKLVNASSSLNKLKTNIDALDVDQKDFKKLSDPTTLVYINQYNIRQRN